MLPFARYGKLYTEDNVAISGIHTHAGPGGYLQYVVYLVTSLGFVRQSFDVIVDGIEKSIIQAHENLRPGSIFVNKGMGEDFGSHNIFLLHVNMKNVIKLCEIHVSRRQHKIFCV